MTFHSSASLHAPMHPPPGAKPHPVNHRYLAAILPLAIGLVMVLLPAPPRLPLHSWRFLALFVTVIVGLILEPVPAAAVGFLGVTAAAVLAHFVLHTPAQLAVLGFNANGAAISWTFSGFSNSTVWLTFAVFVFSLGYEKTGFGKRISLLLSWLGDLDSNQGFPSQSRKFYR